MATPTLPTARFKLEIPRELAEIPGRASLLEQNLIKWFSPDYTIQRDGDWIEVGGEIEGTHSEALFTIRAENGFKSDLITAISLFLKDQSCEYLSFRSSLILSQANLFDNTLKCQLQGVPVQRVCFGNIFNNQFYDHWQISFRDNHYPNLPRWIINSDEPTMYKIKADFNFDCPAPINVTFCVPETRDKGRSHWNVYATYKLSVNGESIERIIVDTRHNERTFRVYLVLTAPVFIKQKDEDNYRRDNKRRCSKEERVFQIKWGRESAVNSSISVFTENPIFCMEFPAEEGHNQLYSILSRLRSRWMFPIEFTAISDHPKNINGGLQEKESSRVYCIRDGFHMKDGILLGFCETLFPNVRAFPGERNKAQDKINERKFSYVYLIQTLLSRGSIVKDQLLLDPSRWNEFLNIIDRYFLDEKDHNLCESALEDLVRYVDSSSRIGDLFNIFENYCKARHQSQVSNQLTPEQWDEGYRKVRKAVITPTRIKFFIPETIMGNRAMNAFDHDGTRVIRVVFRDDNGCSLSSGQMTLKNGVLSSLRTGFMICDRAFGYLGSSCSQMRTHGAYFLERYSKSQLLAYRKENNRTNGFPPPHFKPKIHNCRKELGDFEEAASVPLAMARLGQTFTQARLCGVNIHRSDYQIVADICGGKNAKGEPYTFTDGVGRISLKLATQIAKFFKFPNGYVPSAFQFRFLGCKGVLQVDPGLDEFAAMPFSQNQLQLLFRKSQSKFTNSKRSHAVDNIELVKWSSPATTTLNRPFINILDQVSASQSLPCHKRICSRIEELLDVQLNSYTSWIVNEKSCRAKLEEMPRRVHFAYLKESCGFSLSTEPFFRSLIKAAVDVSITRLVKKIQIQVPASLGRTMYGVTDESGQLQYGQVFFQYTDDVSKKYPGKMTPKTIHTGDVLVTKFPATVPGDVRIFEAVDIPELRHLENVIVFPQTGPRPHPDEMAGSDLDGDEYAIIWDPQLFFEHNEEAFEYCSEKPKQVFDKTKLDGKMHEFFAEYIAQEPVGRISNNHLYQSDQHGLDAEVCDRLAKKGTMVLDYAKSGVAPARLTYNWAPNPDTGNMEPPEQAQRIPDFAGMAHAFNIKPMYLSPRLLGTLFRGLRSIQAVVDSSTDIIQDIVPDETLICPDWEHFVRNAKSQMARYNAQLRSLMDNAGVRSEAEVFSGCIRETFSRNPDQKGDDLSIFNAENILENGVTTLFRTFREEFFAEFGDIISVTEPEYVNPRYEVEETDILRRVCRNPSQQIMAKAVAYYRVCYDNNAPNQGDRMLSFAWIGYDVLNHIKQEYIKDCEELPAVIHPQFEVLQENICRCYTSVFQAISKHRKQYFEKNRVNFKIFMNRQLAEERPDNLEYQATKVIKKYVEKYNGLGEVLCIIDAWARDAKLLKDDSEIEENMDEAVRRKILRLSAESRLKWYHVCLMFIMFAKNDILSTNEFLDYNIPLLQDLTADGAEDTVKDRELTESELDKLTFCFFRYLSSRQFKRIQCLNFSSCGVSSIFYRGEWIPYHKSAIRTYYNILLNWKFDEFLTDSESESLENNSIREGNPFIIELPKGVDESKIYELLKRKTKCTEVTGRKLDKGQNDMLLISSRGTVEALQELRDFAAIRIPRYSYQHEKDNSRALALMTFYKITGITWNEEEQKKERDKKQEVQTPPPAPVTNNNIRKIHGCPAFSFPVSKERVILIDHNAS